MPLTYETWSPDRRIDSTDLADGFKWPLDNLARFVKAFLQPASGIYRGGAVVQTGPPSKNVIVNPLGGVAPSGELLVLEGQVVLAVPDNASGFDRIDRISIGPVTVDEAAVSRWFWNEGSGIPFTQNVTVAKTLRAVPVLTVGTAAANPVAPPLPAGHIALATVLVSSGFSAVVDADITPISAPDPFALVEIADAGNHAVPYEPAARLRTSTRAGGATLLFAVLTITDPAGTTIDWGVGPEVPQVHSPLKVTIEEVDGAVVATAIHRMMVGDVRTMLVAGIVPGPREAVEYQLRIVDTFDSPSGTPGIAWAVLRLSDAPGVFGALSL